MGEELVLVILFRAIERILAVAIGGLLIYFGYRLFLAIPDQSADGSAELSLAEDKRLIVTRVGPGTFFALFGTAVLVASYAFPTSWTGEGGGYSGLGSTDPVVFRTDTSDPLPPRPLSPDEIRTILAFLSDVEGQHADGLAETDRAHAARRFREAKVAIMGRGWQPEWGDPVEFEIWLNETPPRTPRQEFERALSVLEAKE